MARCGHEPLARQPQIGRPLGPRDEFVNVRQPFEPRRRIEHGHVELGSEFLGRSQAPEICADDGHTRTCGERDSATTCGHGQASRAAAGGLSVDWNFIAGGAPVNSIKSFLKATLVGGLMFLVPVVLVALVLRHALQFAGKIAQPIAAVLPISHLGGVAIATIIAVAILLCIAFLAGLLSRTGPGRRVTHWFEESILGGMPQYRMVKSLAEGLTQLETGTGMQPVLMRGDEGWMLGYQMEETAGRLASDFPAGVADANVGQCHVRRSLARAAARSLDARRNAAGQAARHRFGGEAARHQPRCQRFELIRAAARRAPALPVHEPAGLPDRRPRACAPSPAHPGASPTRAGTTSAPSAFRDRRASA